MQKAEWINGWWLVPLLGRIVPLAPFLGGQIALATLLQCTHILGREAGFDMPLVYTSLLVNKSYRIICWDSARNPVQRSVQLLYPCEYAGWNPAEELWVSSQLPCASAGICKYNCSHFPLIEIKKQLRIKLFKLIGILNLKHFSFFGWYHCLD